MREEVRIGGYGRELLLLKEGVELALVWQRTRLRALKNEIKKEDQERRRDQVSTRFSAR